MKYVHKPLGRSAENSSGGGGRGLAKEITLLSLLTLAGLAVLYLMVGLITDFAVARISPQQEAALFEDWYADAFPDEVPVALEAQWSMAERILTKLVAHPEVPALDYQLGFLDQPEPNAFAAPGGHIVLTRGLLEVLEEEIAVAFVLAHELGHFAGRDHLQGLGRRTGFMTLLALVTGGAGPPLLSSAGELVTLSYSRREERAADDFALLLIDWAYGTREGADRLFEILVASDSLPGWAYMLTTHPNTEERLNNIREGR
jgi:Zn-dependent protease with chaperone function